MAGSLNKQTLIGHLGMDPDVKVFATGGRIAKFTVATGESWTDKKTGEKRERTDWHNIVVRSDGLVGVVERFLHKGSKVYLEGSTQTRSYEKDGQQRSITEVIISGFGGTLLMLDGKDKSSGQGNADPYAPAGTTPFPSKKAGKGLEDLDDEIPF